MSIGRDVADSTAELFSKLKDSENISLIHISSNWSSPIVHEVSESRFQFGSQWILLIGFYSTSTPISAMLPLTLISVRRVIGSFQDAI